MTFPSRPRSSHALVVALLAVLAGLTLTPPATATSVTVADPASRPARSDLSSATYADRQEAVSARVQVRRLRLTGKVRLRVSTPGSKVRYVASVAAPAGTAPGTTPGTTPGTSLVRVASGSRTPVACDLTASWSTGTDDVRVRVPQSCLAFGHFRDRHTMTATLSVGAHRDAAATRTVGRGDTPGCATAGEIRRLHTGERRGIVHSHLDTAGRFGDGGAGGFSRLYRACDGGEPFFVEYDGQTSRVIGKGRVR